MSTTDYINKIKRGRTHKDALLHIAHNYFQSAEGSEQRRFLEEAYWELKQQIS